MKQLPALVMGTCASIAVLTGVGVSLASTISTTPEPALVNSVRPAPLPGPSRQPAGPAPLPASPSADPSSSGVGRAAPSTGTRAADVPASSGPREGRSEPSHLPTATRSPRATDSARPTEAPGTSDAPEAPEPSATPSADDSGGRGRGRGGADDSATRTPSPG